MRYYRNEKGTKNHLYLYINIVSSGDEMKRNTAEIIMSFKSQMYAKHRKNTTENYSNAGAIMETLNYVSRVSELQMTEAKNREHCERQPHQRPKGPNKNGIGSVLCL